MPLPCGGRGEGGHVPKSGLKTAIGSSVYGKNQLFADGSMHRRTRGADGAA
jgi:hypothetical protein